VQGNDREFDRCRVCTLTFSDRLSFDDLVSLRPRNELSSFSDLS